MKKSLSELLSLAELHKALLEMKPSKSLGSNGIIVDFYKCFWDIMGEEYMIMLEEGIRQGHLPNDMIQGTIALVHKGRKRFALTN